MQKEFLDFEDLLIMKLLLNRIACSWEKALKRDFSSKQQLLSHETLESFVKHVSNCLTKTKGKELASKGLPTLENLVLMFPEHFTEEDIQLARNNLSSD